MDPRFLLEDGVGIFTGNELIVKGGLEHRMGMLTGYPGSPVAEVFDAAERIRELLVDKGVVVQIANNEALSAARLNGTQMTPVRAMAVMKSVGVHVASDGLALGNMAGTAPGGAAVAVFGDDTWSEGTQVPADSRFIARHLFMPILEPSTFQEIKDWIGVAFDLSEKTRLYVAFLITSNQADGGGTVTVGPNRFPDLTAQTPVTIDTSSIPLDDRVIIPPSTAVKEEDVLHRRMPAMLEYAREYNLNRILYPPVSGKKRIGFISSSLAYCYLEHVMNMVGLEGSIPILKYGLTHPVDPEILKAFVSLVDDIYVVEEKRGFLEGQVTGALQGLHQDGEIGPFRIWGKRFPKGQPGFPDSKGMNPSILLQALAPILLDLDDATVPIDRERIAREVDLVNETADYQVQAAVRTPSFCPGCPHRDSASVLNRVIDDFGSTDYMRKHHQRDPADLVFHGDIGCYSLLKYKPFDRLMHNLSGMGLGGGTGAGIDPYIDNKQLVFMGDSTFFHSGMAAISDSIKHGQDITYVILDNKTTAMTGHQPTPGVDVDILGKPTFAQDIEQVVRGMAGTGDSVYIARMNPAERTSYRQTLESALLKDGVKIVIADKECGITFHRRQRSLQNEIVRHKGYLPEERHINVTPEVCEYCLECTRATGCSGLTVEETLHGPKIATDLSLCVADGACTRVTVSNGDGTCPSFEEVIIKRTRPAQRETEAVDLSNLPAPEVKAFNATWYAYIAGVGGMGINTIAAILSVAGARQGYTVRFTNKKGLAIRNGAVYSHVSFAKGDRVISQITPYGHADLLLGLDILEAVRGLESMGNGRVASPGHTTAVVETGKRHTVLTLTGQDEFDTSELEDVLKRHTKSDGYFGMALGEVSERFLGNKIYANSILLGVAFQRGVLPLELEHIKWSMERNIKRSDLEPNLKAFDLGRKIAVDPEAVAQEKPALSCGELIEDKAGILERGKGRSARAAFLELASTVELLPLDEEDRLQFALGVYDLMQWDGADYARSYVRRVRKVFKCDRPEEGYEATRAVIRYLPRVMAYKDEVYVAHLLTSEEKYRRDCERYKVCAERGDRIAYRHFNRGNFNILGFNVYLKLTTRDWMLKLMKRMKFLRKLLPSWHKEEKAYRDWYVEFVDRFEFDHEERYGEYVRVFRVPDEVRGYREVIRPKIEAAYQAASAMMDGNGRPPVTEPYLSIEPVAERV